jgi:hypothetical protein
MKVKALEKESEISVTVGFRHIEIIFKQFEMRDGSYHHILKEHLKLSKCILQSELQTKF